MDSKYAAGERLIRVFRLFDATGISLICATRGKKIHANFTASYEAEKYIKYKTKRYR